VQATATATRKALTPYAPTQARARRTNEGIVISFIRLGRLDSYAWETLDIPLGEASEAYEIEIALPGNGRRLLASSGQSVLYPAGREIDDFGATQTSIAISIFQMSASVGRGFPYSATLAVN